MNIKKILLFITIIMSLTFVYGCSEKKENATENIGEQGKIRSQVLKDLNNSIQRYKEVSILDVKLTGDLDEKNIDIYMDINKKAGITLDDTDIISEEIAKIQNDKLKNEDVKHLNIVWVIEDDNTDEKYNMYYNYTIGDNYKLENKFVDDKLEKNIKE